MCVRTLGSKKCSSVYMRRYDVNDREKFISVMNLNIKATMSVRTSNIYTLNLVLRVCEEISGCIHVALIGLSCHGEITIITSFQVVKPAHVFVDLPNYKSGTHHFMKTPAKTGSSFNYSQTTAAVSLDMYYLYYCYRMHNH